MEKLAWPRLPAIPDLEVQLHCRTAGDQERQGREFCQRCMEKASGKGYHRGKRRPGLEVQELGVPLNLNIVLKISTSIQSRTQWIPLCLRNWEIED